MSKEIEFLKGVDKLHAFYTENVRMLAHAYDLEDEEAAQLLGRYDYRNVSRSILRPPRVDPLGQIIGDQPQQSDSDEDSQGS
ncbi:MULTISPECIES: hypothetical protein [Kocuria]|uniref:Uncharacterized protein n=1 Tax=Kocuria palustris PEL TaxID=1236550 RepID=M2XRZ7_9MICC|nr:MULTISPECIES: hypothetical protein [Kocuria]MDN5573003.1 hypothetical protein [Micrococcales bacterium]EME35588.1 hypothetical protein C884_01475 [Kocuria palustris PEL]MCM3331810.1 hypothetical protein [Kocuria palustris]MCT1591674.1 hypothetical protein [Kocuria palustris]MCT1835303.1 hypothetical protein [Kocuria palustris]